MFFLETFSKIFQKKYLYIPKTKEEYSVAFAEMLTSLRKKNKMTQDALAQRINLARSTIAGYENKKRQPSYETLAMLADFFHVSIDFLLTGRESVYSPSHPEWCKANKG